MREVAQEERAELGLGPTDPLDPYALAEEHGISVYTLDNLGAPTSPTNSAITCWSTPSTP
ncbi:hypothetical protein [Streptomyces sp. NPDC003554]